MKRMIGIGIGLLLLSVVKAQDREAEIDSVLAARPVDIRNVRVEGVRLELRGLYVLEGLLWFSLRVSNGSVIDFRANSLRFTIRDRHVLRRKARQELPLTVLLRREPLLVRSDSSVTLCYGLAPRLPAKGQDLVLEYGEHNGDRRMRLRLSAVAILKAKKLD
ncbi:DUF4138 domain-containing protein [Puia dinghuensis]|uniref:Uncharacterized protein n=1 Tax=Puia dinghuensis TaxID=1792502 RepID=A0A8J2UHT6_9BACT|nr:DUF4138 domain-containing protein [Puia dinghuensis]GGB20137.1 hypothetical protein GCM10011511_49840 [Puia dinghuensis]